MRTARARKRASHGSRHCGTCSGCAAQGSIAPRSSMSSVAQMTRQTPHLLLLHPLHNRQLILRTSLTTASRCLFCLLLPPFFTFTLKETTSNREEFIAKKLREKREGAPSTTTTEETTTTKEETSKEEKEQEQRSTKEDNDLNEPTSFARVAEVTLPATFRERNIRATEEATRAFFEQRQRERERLAADPLARFGRVPEALPHDEAAERRARDNGRATDTLVYERFVKHARRF